MAASSFSRSNTSGLSDSQHSTSSSASLKYQISQDDPSPILLYKYRGALQISSQKDLCAWLDKDETLRVTKKPIPRGTSYIDIKRNDLYLDDEKQLYRQYPNYDSSLASIKLPSLPYWSRLIFGTYDELYIVSPESSTNSSIVGDDSRQVSPSTTLAKDLDARLGALVDNRAPL